MTALSKIDNLLITNNEDSFQIGWTTEGKQTKLPELHREPVISDGEISNREVYTRRVSYTDDYVNQPIFAKKEDSKNPSTNFTPEFTNNLNDDWKKKFDL